MLLHEPMIGSDSMRAVVHDRYRPPEVLRLDEVERPLPADDEVLVKVHATTVARMDLCVPAGEAVRSQLSNRKELPYEEIWNDTDEPVLRLITCAGSYVDGSYVENLIIYGE